MVLNLRYKKGNITLDVILIIVIFLAFVLSGFFAKYILSGLNDDIQTDTALSNSTKEMVQKLDNNFGSFYDNLFILMFSLLWILLLVSAYFSENHPLFFVFSVLLFIFVFVIAMILGNTYQEIIGEDGLSSLTSNFPFAHWIMSHFLISIIVVAFTVVIVMFGKNYGQV